MKKNKKSNVKTKIDNVQIDKNKINTYHIVNIIKENCTWVIEILTFLGLITKALLKFVEHITSELYFSYYGLNHNLYNYSDKGFIYDLLISIIFVLALLSVLLCFEQLKNKFKSKKIICLENFENVILIIISNLYIIKTTPEKVNINEIIILMIVLIIIEFIISYMFFKKIKNADNNSIDREQLKKMFINYIKLIPYIMILLIITNGARIYMKLQYQKEYNVIAKNKAVVYATNDYYLTLDCNINGDKIVIYRGSQEKIDNNNIKTELIEFDKVEIIDKKNSRN